MQSSSFDLSLNRQSAIKNRQCLGGGEGTRTPDPRVANAVLCQLSYTPDKFLRSQISDLRSQKVGCGGGI